jgi:hypothetical protein
MNTSGNVPLRGIADTTRRVSAPPARVGPLLKAGEDSTWNNLLNNIQNHCGSGGAQ